MNIGAAMKIAVLNVKAISNQHIHVELANGATGIFDVSPYWHKGILRELQEPAYFRQVSIAYGAVTWPHGQDIAPDTLLKNLQPALAS
jgi:hypothetical protein